MTRSSTEGTPLADDTVVLPPGPSLAQLPDPIIWQFLRIARSVVCTKFVPLLWKRVALKRRERRLARRVTLQDQLSNERACEAALLEASEYVVSAGAADVAYLLSRRSRPATFLPGEMVAHEREPCAAGVVVVIHGKLALFERVHRSKDSTDYYGLLPADVAKPQPKLRTTVDLSEVMEGESTAALDDHAEEDDFTKDFRGEQHPPHLRFCRQKRKGLTNTRFLRTVEAPFVIGDIAMLNNEPRLYYAVAQTQVDAMIIPKQAFLNVFQAIPNPAITLRLVSIAHAIRASNMQRAFPLTTSRLRMSALLRNLQEDDLEKILVFARPRVFARGMSILDKGRLCHHIYVIRRGVVEETTEIASARRSGTSTGNAGVKTFFLSEGATFGDREACFKEKSLATYVAESNVDMYMIAIEDVMRLGETVRARIAEAARLIRAAVEAASSSAKHEDDSFMSEKRTKAQFLPHTDAGSGIKTAQSLAEHIREIPLWRAVDMPADLLQFVLPLWKSRRFQRGEYVFRKSETCAAMMILMRGGARLVDAPACGTVIPVGECVGYTCLLQHRWEFSCLATETSEFAVLEVERLYEALHQWDRGGVRMPSALWLSDDVDMESSLFANPVFEQPAPIVADISAQPGKLYTRLLHACQQLLQPLLRRSAGFSSNPKIDAVVRRTPNPNSFEELAVANLHPISLDDYVRRFPPFASERARASRHKSDSTTRSAAAADAAKKRLVEELAGEMDALSVASFTREKSIHKRNAHILVAVPVESSTPPSSRAPDGNRRQTAAPSAPAAIQFEDTADKSLQKEFTAAAAATREPAIGSVASIIDVAGNLVSPQGHGSGTTLPGERKSPLPFKRKVPSAAQKSPAGSPVSLMPDTSLGDLSTTAAPLALDSAAHQNDKDKPSQESKDESRDHRRASSADDLSRTLASVALRELDTDRLHNILQSTESKVKVPSPPMLTKSVADCQNEPDTKVPANKAVPTARDAFRASPPSLLQHRAGRLTRRHTQTRSSTHTNPTYSASDRYGSLLQTMMLRATAGPTTSEHPTQPNPHSAPGHSMTHLPSASEAPAATLPSPTPTVVPAPPAATGYMWRSCSVAAPLLSARPRTATLVARIAEVQRRVSPPKRKSSPYKTGPPKQTSKVFGAGQMSLFMQSMDVGSRQ